MAMIFKKPITVIIYLIGKPGTGKYTIAKEIAHHGYAVCDNQLINNPIFALLHCDGLITAIPEFAWHAIEKIRDIVFDFISINSSKNYVLTNVLYEDEYDNKLFKQVQQLAAQRNSLFIPVKLYVSEAEHIKRIQNQERLVRYKSIDINEVYKNHTLIEVLHPHLMELDVSNLSAESAAMQILTHMRQQKDKLMPY
jgi:Cdc6-like AAA superfamily ATPase